MYDIYYEYRTCPEEAWNTAKSDIDNFVLTSDAKNVHAMMTYMIWDALMIVWRIVWIVMKRVVKRTAAVRLILVMNNVIGINMSLQ